MTEKEVLQQQDANQQKAFYLIAVGMFYHAYGCGAFALARATGYRVLRKHLCRMIIKQSLKMETLFMTQLLFLLLLMFTL